MQNSPEGSPPPHGDWRPRQGSPTGWSPQPDTPPQQYSQPEPPVSPSGQDVLNGTRRVLEEWGHQRPPLQVPEQQAQEYPPQPPPLHHQDHQRLPVPPGVQSVTPRRAAVAEPQPGLLSRLFTSRKQREEREAAARAVQEEESRRQQRFQHMLHVIDSEVDKHRITVSSLKGGVTKTTTVLGVGTALAMHRRSSVTAVDGNPHRGTAAERLGEEHTKTVRDLILNAADITTASEYRRYTNVARSRLEVIAAHKDPREAQVFTADEYRLVMEIITTFRPLVITDTGTDLLTPLMEEVYQTTDTLVVPATTAEDGWRLAWETLDWWEKTSRGAELVRNAIVPITQIETFSLPDPTMLPDQQVLNAQRHAFEQAQASRAQELIEHLSPRVGQVVLVPHDPSLKRGGLFDWDQLQPATQDAYLTLAYEICSRFPPPA